MKNKYKILADILLTIHIMVGLFILSGWIFTSIKIIYLVVIILWISSWVFLGYCPLTKIELILRKKYNPTINTNQELIQYYVHKFFGIFIPEKTILISGLIGFIFLIFLSITYQ